MRNGSSMSRDARAGPLSVEIVEIAVRKNASEILLKCRRFIVVALIVLSERKSELKSLHTAPSSLHLRAREYDNET